MSRRNGKDKGPNASFWFAVAGFCMVCWLADYLVGPSYPEPKCLRRFHRDCL